MDPISAYDALAMEGDPFRQGTDACCAAHTNANIYKRALNGIRTGDGDPAVLMAELRESTRLLLASGYRMAEVSAKIYVLELRP